MNRGDLLVKYMNEIGRELRRSVRETERILSGIRTLWGAEWCQVGLDHLTTACPTLLAYEPPNSTLSKPPYHHHHHFRFVPPAL